MINFSIIIPTYNRVRYLSATLDSVFTLQVPDGIKVELLVIDNNCTDGTADLVCNKSSLSPFPCRYIVEKQQGLCFSRNRAIEEAQYEYLVYLDDDIQVNPRWLEGCAEAVSCYDADAVVGPVYPMFEQKKPSYLVGPVLDSISSGYSRKGDEILILPKKTAHELPGCNFGVRKKLANEIGKFNVGLDRAGDGLLAGGDFEFGHRLVETGSRTVYHPLCSIDHVILGEKLSRSYLRRRWYGVGASVRRMRKSEMSAYHFSRAMAGAFRLGVSSLLNRGMGRTQTAFEQELQMMFAFGQLLG